MTHMIELQGWRVSYKMNAQQSGSLLYCQFIQCNSSRGDSFFFTKSVMGLSVAGPSLVLASLCVMVYCYGMRTILSEPNLRECYPLMISKCQGESSCPRFKIKIKLVWLLVYTQMASPVNMNILAGEKYLVASRSLTF